MRVTHSRSSMFIEITLNIMIFMPKWRESPYSIITYYQISVTLPLTWYNSFPPYYAFTHSKPSEGHKVARNNPFTKYLTLNYIYTSLLLVHLTEKRPRPNFLRWVRDGQFVCKRVYIATAQIHPLRNVTAILLLIILCFRFTITI